MERKNFLRNSFTALGLVAVAPLMNACKKEDVSGSTTPTTGGSSGNGSCTEAPTETQGPYPTKQPSAYVRSNIVDDRTGVPFTVTITIQNTNNSCAALANAIVDIWHCDAAGNYSEYGGTGMQSTNYQSVHFLRGRQETNSDGLASFRTIFPGWYSGRAPHIHVHVYDSSGNSLLVTQIAFPTDVCNTVYTTATTLYTKGTQDTSNASDNIFSDSLDSELATVTGSIAEGYLLKKTIVVS